MEFLDVFSQNAFSAITLTAAVQRNPYQPQTLGELNIFTPNPIRTTAVAVEERQGVLRLIPFSERGAEGTQRTTEQRKMRYFDTKRLMHDDTIRATELQNIRAFPDASVSGGIMTVPMQFQQEVDRRLNGPTGLMASVEFTKEYLRLAAIQGFVLDPKDGSIVYNWFDEFQITQAAEQPFNLAAGQANSLRPICNQIVRTMARKSQGAFLPSTKVYGLCGDAFYDALTNHPDVIRTFINWSDAKDLRNGAQGGAFKYFEFADIVWLNYRGSDDNATIKIPDDKVKFFPVGAPGIFQEAMAPGETVEWVNTPGQPVYVLPIPDLIRKMWWKAEVYAYPLMLCTRPEVLLSGRAGA